MYQMLESLYVFYLLWISLLHWSDCILCPPQLRGQRWTQRAWSVCPHDIDQYHCLSTQTEDFVEVCLPRLNISEGHYPAYSRAGKKIYSRPCPNNLYQPAWQWSNRIYKCEYTKTKCVSKSQPGQLTCNHGNTTTDGACYCDYKAGYVASLFAFSNPLKLRCYVPSRQSSKCFKIRCDPGQELNSAYECVPVCDPGMYRPDHELTCVNLPSTISEEVASTTETSTITTTFHHVIYRPVSKNLPSSHTVTAQNEAGGKVKFIALVLVFFFVFIIVFWCLPKRYYYKKLRNFICRKCCGKQDFLSKESYPLPTFSRRTTPAGTPMATPFMTPYSSPVHTPAHTPLHTPAHTPRLNRSRCNRLQVPVNINRSISNIDSPEAEAYLLGTRRLSKSESQLPGPQDVAKLRLLKNTKSSSKIATRSKTKQRSPLAKGNCDNHPLSSKSTQYMNQLSAMNEPSTLQTSTSLTSFTYVGKKIVNKYYINKVEHGNFGDNNVMSINYKGSEQDEIDDSENSQSSGASSSSDSLPKSEHDTLETSKPLPTLTTIEEAMTVLKDFVKDKYDVEDVPHDGHCLYHCVQEITGSALGVTELREWVAKFLITNEDRYKSFICDSRKQGQKCPSNRKKTNSRRVDGHGDEEMVWTDYLQGVIEDEWGDYVVIDALANIFLIQITVISTRNPSEPVVVKPLDRDPRYTIYLGHLTDVSCDRDLHFVILRALDVSM